MSLPEVVKATPDEDRCALLLKIAADSPAFLGHFPGVPILPGITQVDWALKLARLHMPQIEGDFHSLTDLKFRRVIEPNTTLRLELSWSPPQLDFRYVSDTGSEVFSQGRIRL